MVVWNGRVEEVAGDMYTWGLLWCVGHMIDLIHDVIYIHDEHFGAAVAYSRLGYSNTRPVRI